eukprot:TRINITY_DN43187_c0_g1_i1.p2 TRINITY_DN43187_c0_g1~~TRINITY_DN43187_c0_g1_i1.p2  ORF type:complete len:386 (+),score=119.62 TRINITY_DN43187_c0_g1_i1:55-1212(+)
MRTAALVSAVAAVGAACPGQKLLPVPSDPSEPGPWPVGAARVDGITSRDFGVDIFFPAAPGSEQGAASFSYDLRKYTPPGIRAKLPDSLCTPDAVCPVYKDEDGFVGVYENLPLDRDHGPYPVIFYVHGTAAWGSASLKMEAHWASRGFVVVGIDYPGIRLYDLLGATELILPPAIDQPGDTRLMFKELQTLADPRLDWLKGHIDMARVGVAGHSAGGGAVSGLGDIAQVVVPMAGGAPANSPHAKSALVLGGEDDGAQSRINGYNSYQHTPKRLLLVEKAGHQFCTDLCWIGKDHDGVAGIAAAHGVWQAPLFKGLANNGCNFDGVTRYLPAEKGWKLSNYVLSGVFEETLMCNGAMTEKLTRTKDLPYAWDYRQQLTQLNTTA